VNNNEKVLDLLDPARCAVSPVELNGYLDVLDDPPAATSIGARTMRTSFYPVLYEYFRPLGLRLASGLSAPGRDGDRRSLVDRLALDRGAAVLDVACGPGNFTHYLSGIAGPEGLAVGLDASDSMLAKAVVSNGSGPAYLRGDAEALPFRSETFDAVACLAALYLMNNPYTAVGEAVRVLKPGGRLAILTSYSGSDPVTRLATGVIDRVSGIRRFSRHDITAAFQRYGLVEIEQEVKGLTQAVWARKPDDDQG
jgi:ubiquinone/menaquinone biosynthesis C-methylase UbiE